MIFYSIKLSADLVRVRLSCEFDGLFGSSKSALHLLNLLKMAVIQVKYLRERKRGIGILHNHIYISKVSMCFDASISVLVEFSK